MALYIQLAIRANSAPSPFFTPKPRSAKKKKNRKRKSPHQLFDHNANQDPSIPKKRDRLSGVERQKKQRETQAHHEHPPSLPSGWFHLPILAQERERRMPPEETSTWPRTPRSQRERKEDSCADSVMFWNAGLHHPHNEGYPQR
ncbi:hypothetical protein BO99DRAFT_193589 [Aspergillus violaceofuscus CBS 115571]|uniref:Uncharacterized protein n=1 Tax=Aspergillus violaceofuscus (strain CBS 115571) TaxID=1450538 RepID=A0A2V5H5Y0_ASPV1|nr:hypothetical protein BO99DRAFT_193589 [Aspergillus violaceofuscus CBS 115571]